MLGVRKALRMLDEAGAWTGQAYQALERRLFFQKAAKAFQFCASDAKNLQKTAGKSKKMQ
jgi:hypothetical protein